MPNSHTINILDDIWPQRDEWVKFIKNSREKSSFYYDEPVLTCGEYYQIKDISWLPCKDQIFIIDDNNKTFWVDLCDFNYGDNI